jgi:spore coat protein CotH
MKCAMLAPLILSLSIAFGPQVIDLSLRIDDTARHSLESAPETEVPATMTYRDGGAERSYAVTVHVKGQLGSGRSVNDKAAFKIKLAKGERFLGQEHLTLNNMVQDPTMLREALGYQVYEAAGVAVPRTGYVRLMVNGQDYGLYLNVETIDPLFLERRFGDAAGILYEGAYGVDLREKDVEKFQLHEGSDPDHAQLLALIHAVEAPGDGVFYGADAPVDTKEFLSMMAAAMLLDDWDNYYAANNYRIFWSAATRRWSFIPTGIDQTFGGYATTVYGAAGVLFMRCLKSDRCRTDYLAEVRDVAGRFQHLGLATRMDALLSVIDAPSRADPKRPYDDDVMQRAREAMRRFIDNQPARVLEQLPRAGADAK